MRKGPATEFLRPCHPPSNFPNIEKIGSGIEPDSYNLTSMKTRTLLLIIVSLISIPMVVAQQDGTSTTQSTETGEEQPIIIKKGDKVSPPRVVSAPNPIMPSGGVYGTVVIQGVVGTDGKMHSPKVKRSLSPRNDASALEIIPQWRFEPAKKDGKPVAITLSVEVAFFPPKK